MMLFSLLSIVGRGVRLAVINFLFFSMSMVGFIFLFCETMVAIIVGIVGTSTCALLLLMTKILTKPTNAHRKYGAISAIFLFIPAILSVTNKDEWSSLPQKITEIYCGEFQEVTSLISLIFIVVLAGLIFLLPKKKSKTLTNHV